ncbi:MAG TPA: hypothetical protein VGE07_28515 [Herpetosiphonaceae bacterium]
MLDDLRDGLRSFGGRMLATLAYMLGLMLAVAPFALWAPPIARIIAAVLIWLAGSGYAFSRFGDRLDGWGAVLGVAPLFMVAMGLRDYVDLASAPSVAGVSVAAIPLHPAARSFDLTDARIQTDYQATKIVSSRDRKSGRVTTTAYTVAPLTGAGWTPDQPVPAWVGCGPGAASCGEWRDRPQGAIAMDSVGLANYAATRDQAMGQHRLHSAPGAPILQAVESAAAGRRQRGFMIYGVWLIIYALWAVTTGGYLLCRALWRRVGS